MSARDVALIVVCAAVLVSAGCSKDPDVAKQEFLRNGDRYVTQHKYPEAAIEYRNALQQDPGSERHG